MKKLILLRLFLTILGSAMVALVGTARAQATYRGVVSKIIDGRTVAIKTEAGEVQTQMIFIEVPEPEQPLSAIVREHLGKLVLGKSVRFDAARSYSQGVLGMLYLVTGDDAVEALSYE